MMISVELSGGHSSHLIRFRIVFAFASRWRGLILSFYVDHPSMNNSMTIVKPVIDRPPSPELERGQYFIKPSGFRPNSYFVGMSFCDNPGSIERVLRKADTIQVGNRKWRSYTKCCLIKKNDRLAPQLY